MIYIGRYDGELDRDRTTVVLVKNYSVDCKWNEWHVHYLDLKFVTRSLVSS